MKSLTNGDLAAGASNGKIYIFDSISLTVKQTLIMHNGAINDLLELPSDCLASASDDNSIKIWSLNGFLLKDLTNAHWLFVSSLVLLKNGDMVSHGHDGRLNVWDTKSWTRKKKFTSHPSADAYSLITLNNGDLVASYRWGDIQIWDTNSWTMKLSFKGHTDDVRSLVLLPNGDFASASYDFSLKIWYPNGTALNTYKYHTNKINNAILLKSGRLATGSDDGTLIIY